MSIEQDLKETFMKHAEDVRPDVQSWPAVEKKVRRAHTQRVGGTCEACGVEFEKYGLTQLSRMKLESERETARLQKQTSVFREVILAIATGGFSLLKYLRSRR